MFKVMKLPYGKILITTAVLAALPVLVISAIGIRKYLKVKNSHPQIEQPKFLLIPEENIKLGDIVVAQVLLKCPWHRYPVNASLKLCEKAQTLDENQIRLKSVGWGHWTWKIICKIQPYRTGEITGEFKIILNKAPKEKINQINNAIPKFTALPLDIKNSTKLTLASHISRSGRIGKKWLFLALSIFILTAILLAILYFNKKRHKGVIILPPWVIALSQLRELRKNFEENKTEGLFYTAKLTDIVRDYLEKRFALHAPTQTTSEFFTDLDKDNSPLEYEHRSFLREFMAAADLVKFAKFPADLQVLENAMDKAEYLINSTMPQKQSKQNNHEF